MHKGLRNHYKCYLFVFSAMNSHSLVVAVCVFWSNLSSFTTWNYSSMTDRKIDGVWTVHSLYFFFYFFLNHGQLRPLITVLILIMCVSSVTYPRQLHVCAHTFLVPLVCYIFQYPTDVQVAAKYKQIKNKGGKNLVAAGLADFTFCADHSERIWQLTVHQTLMACTCKHKHTDRPIKKYKTIHSRYIKFFQEKLTLSVFCFKRTVDFFLDSSFF